MTSEEQEKKINEKVKQVVMLFLSTKYSIDKISEVTKISTSSVQRYLNSERIIEIFDRETYDLVKSLLKIKLLEAKVKGGKNSSLNNEAIKDSLGHFAGSRKR